MYTYPRFGTFKDDTFFGTTADDSFYGYGGNDLFFGSAGKDYYNGGSGSDTVDYRYARGAVTVDLAAGLGLQGIATGDRYVSVENVVGSNYDDTLIGNKFDNVLDGRAGDDHFVASGGNDTIIGGAGHDTLDYSQFNGGWVIVRLDGGDGGVVWKGPEQSFTTDTVSDIETVIGTDGSDIFYGDQGSNEFIGGGGGDLFKSDAGSDTYIGGSGNDRVSYDGTTGQIYIDLANGIAQNGDAAGDTLSEIENIDVKFGEGHLILGDAGSNTLSALNVNGSAFYGRGGNDVFSINYQAEGNVYNGGAGTDTLDLIGGSRNPGDELRPWEIDLQAGFAREVGGADNKVVGIENVNGTGRDDDIRGNKGANELDGDYGNDDLDGRGGDDILTGGDGQDTFHFDHSDAADFVAEHDVITDFEIGQDIVDLSGTDVSDLSDLTSSRDGDYFEQVGRDVVIHTSNLDAVTLQNILLSDLSQTDFLF